MCYFLMGCEVISVSVTDSVTLCMPASQGSIVHFFFFLTKNLQINLEFGAQNIMPQTYIFVEN